MESYTLRFPATLLIGVFIAGTGVTEDGLYVKLVMKVFMLEETERGRSWLKLIGNMSVGRIARFSCSRLASHAKKILSQVQSSVQRTNRKKDLQKNDACDNASN